MQERATSVQFTKWNIATGIALAWDTSRLRNELMNSVAPIPMTVAQLYPWKAKALEESTVVVGIAGESPAVFLERGHALSFSSSFGVLAVCMEGLWMGDLVKSA